MHIGENAYELSESGLLAFLEHESEYSIRRQGYHKVIKKIEEAEGLSLEPVIFIPSSSHYSLKKAVNLLGYGEKAVRLIPLTKEFRINPRELDREIRNLNENEYVAAVIVVAGTTEEGAVDPIHEVKFLRDELRKEGKGSFWLHVDAAWGGYVRVLFCDEKFDEVEIETETDSTSESIIDRIADHYIDNMGIAEDFEDPNPKGKMPKTNLSWTDKAIWASKDVIKAFLAMKSADSVTVDPHKLGYIPYPAGVIAFRNREYVKLIAQEAKYIFKDGDDDITQNVGPYILEGSKPGAAALACWFMAKTVPLDLRHHGQIIKGTILNAQRLKHYLDHHWKEVFLELEKRIAEAKVKKLEKEAAAKREVVTDLDLRRIKDELTLQPFRFVPLYDNIDTNIVCFLVIPLKWQSDTPTLSRGSKRARNHSCSLYDINRFNKAIYDEFTIEEKSRNINSCGFFLSSSTLTERQYPFSSIGSILKDKIIGITEEEYKKRGLFVIRSTIMNPWHDTYKNVNANGGIDYFMEFITELHKVSRAKALMIFGTKNGGKPCRKS